MLSTAGTLSGQRKRPISRQTPPLFLEIKVISETLFIKWVIIVTYSTPDSELPIR
jgi:hypothetical protein